VDEAIRELVGTARGELFIKLVAEEADVRGLDGYRWVSLAGCTLERVPGKQNWVDEVGGLPEYICEIARAIHRKGRPVSYAIAIAVETVKKWSAGLGDVNADTRAKAAKAVAEWEAKKAAAKVKGLLDEA
jgi:hypothetical protein